MKSMLDWRHIVALEFKAHIAGILCVSTATCLIIHIAGLHHAEYSMREQLLWALGGFEPYEGIPSLSLVQLSRWLLVIAPPLCLIEIAIDAHRRRIVPIMLRIQSYNLLWWRLCAIIIAISALYVAIMIGGMTVGYILTHGNPEMALEWRLGTSLFAVLGSHIAWLGFVALLFESLINNRGIAMSIILLAEGGTAAFSQIMTTGAWLPGAWGMLNSFSFEGNSVRDIAALSLQFVMIIAISASTRLARHFN